MQLQGSAELWQQGSLCGLAWNGSHSTSQNRQQAAPAPPVRLGPVERSRFGLQFLCGRPTEQDATQSCASREYKIEEQLSGHREESSKGVTVGECERMSVGVDCFGSPHLLSSIFSTPYPDPNQNPFQTTFQTHN